MKITIVHRHLWIVTYPNHKRDQKKSEELGNLQKDCLNLQKALLLCLTLLLD